MPTRPLPASSLPYASAAAGALLTLLCGLTLATGVSQQWFEWARAPDLYAQALVRDGSWLRAIIAIDDLFIAAYVTSTVMLGLTLARGRPDARHLLVIAGGVAAGVLDLDENHHLLALVRLARDHVPIPVEQILRRTDLSQLKWMLGHLAFVLAGTLIPARDRLTKFFRATLIGWQLPIGALVWAVEDPHVSTLLVWMRYGAFVSGFAMIAWLSRPRGGPLAEPAAADSSAPA